LEHSVGQYYKQLSAVKMQDALYIICANWHYVRYAWCNCV